MSSTSSNVRALPAWKYGAPAETPINDGGVEPEDSGGGGDHVVLPLGDRQVLFGVTPSVPIAGNVPMFRSTHWI